MRHLLTALTVATLLATSTTLNAQEPEEKKAIPAPEPKGSPEWERRITALEKELKELKSRVSKHDDDLQTLAKGVLKNEGNITANSNSIQNNSDSITANRDGIASVRKIAGDNNNKLADLGRRIGDNDLKLRQIARFDSDSGEYIVDFLGNMQKSPSFRREVHRQTKNRLRIRNTTGRERYLYINGVRWRVLANRWSYAPVARGPVTVQKFWNGSRIVLNNWRLGRDGQGFVVFYDLRDHRELPIVSGGDVEAGTEVF